MQSYQVNTYDNPQTTIQANISHSQGTATLGNDPTNASFNSQFAI